MIVLAAPRQKMDELVTDYIDRWSNLAPNCKDRLSEPSAIDMCIQGMCWGLHYILKEIKPHSFEKLAIRAHDMKLNIDAYRDPKLSDSQKVYKKKEWKTSKGKKAMTITTKPTLGKKIHYNKNGF